MTTIDKIITKVSGKYGAPMGRINKGTTDHETILQRVYDCRVNLCSGGYDKGGVYWGLGSELRVRYTKDLNFIQFYRKSN